MRAQDEFKQELREIRARKFRRMFDPILAVVDDDLDEKPLRFYLRRVRPLLVAQQQQDAGKRPYSARPSWSLPSPSLRGRPIGTDHQRIPHTRNRVGSHQSDKGVAQAVIAERYNGRQEREREAAPISAVAAHDAADDLDVAAVPAIDADHYLNRLERDAIAGGLPSGLRTNMDPEAAAREREWTARTRHERKAGKPRINIRSERNPALCAAIAADPRWPAGLRIAIAADLDRRSRGKNRPKSKKAGEPWIANDAEAVLGDIRQAYHLDVTIGDAALSFGRPRAGRVMYKWDAELPRELDEDGRQAYLDRMAAALDATRITFVLVMHRPDPANHPDNFHVHLLYSDRPVARDEDGVFDIERTVDRDYGRGRRANVHERQNKMRFVADRDWTATLRTMHVDQCNYQLELAGARGRYNPGGFADIGLGDETPQRKLGTSAARLEAAGIATEIGVTNAFIDWERVDDRRRRRHERRLARIAALQAAREARDTVDAHALAAWHLAALDAEHARVAAEEIEDTIAQALSRPLATAARTTAIASTYPTGSYDCHRWKQRGDEAEAALVVIERDLASEREALTRARDAVAAAGRMRDRQRQRMHGDRTAVVTLARSTAGTAPSPTKVELSASRAHRFIDRNERRGIAVGYRDGRFGYADDALRPFRLSNADFTTPPLQARLFALHARQQREIAGVSKLAARAFVLEPRSDTPHFRTLIERWRDHPDVVAASPRPAAVTPAMPPRWKRAAAQFEALMVQSDADERLYRDDRNVITRGAPPDLADQPSRPRRRLAPGLATRLDDYGR